MTSRRNFLQLATGFIALITACSSGTVEVESSSEVVMTISSSTSVVMPPTSETFNQGGTGSCEGPACFSAILSKNLMVSLNFGGSKLMIHGRAEDGSFGEPFYFDLPLSSSNFGLNPILIAIGPENIVYVQIPSSGTDPLGKVYAISTDEMHAAIVGESEIALDMSGDGKLIASSNGIALEACCGPTELNRMEFVLGYVSLSQVVPDDVAFVTLTLDANGYGVMTRLMPSDQRQVWDIERVPDSNQRFPRTIATCDGGAALWLQNGTDGILFTFAPDGSQSRQNYLKTSLIALDPLGGVYIRTQMGLPVLDQPDTLLNGDLCL